MSYLAIRAYNNYIVDTLLNCLSANDDLVIIKESEALSFNVLNNDFGQNIQVLDIIEIPQCGELLDWATDGKMTYRMGEGCIEDEISYELENNLGEKAVASVRFQKDTEEEEMYLDWELECTDYFSCELYVKIEEGTPPYTIDGYYNDVIEENEFFLYLNCYDDVVFEVSDSIGQIATFKMKDIEHFCGGGDCYEPLFAYQYFEIEYLGEHGGVVHYLDRMQSVLIERSFWIDSNNKYHELKEFDTIPNNSYYYLELQYFGHIDGFINCKTVDIEAVDDFGNTLPGEAVFINVLENDLGDGLRLNNIILSPQCGEIAHWQEDGTVVYTVAFDTECTVDTFLYEIEDNWGEKDTATVGVIIEEYTDLIVQVERDCSSVSETGNYILNIVFVGGVPPYQVNMNGIQDTFQKPEHLTYTLTDGEPYEVVVTDDTGEEFYDTGGGVPCNFHWWNPCELEQEVNSEITCLGSDSVVIEIKSGFETATYTNLEGKKHNLNAIDTILTPAFLSIDLENGYVWDTLLNCLIANDDRIEIVETEVLSFNVLDNDFGQNIYVTNIIEVPQCGELLNWSADGRMDYKMLDGNECINDAIVYEIENDLGEKFSAQVNLKKVSNRPMYLNWEIGCDDMCNCTIEIDIVDGVAPYAIEGTVFEEMLETDDYSFTTGCGAYIELEITDSNGEKADLRLINTGTFFESFDCYEPAFATGYPQIDCLGELGGSVNYQFNPTLLERSFWIDSNNQYHELKEFDTIPNNSYYYLELQYFGHIDGFINCKTADIKAVDDFGNTLPGEPVTINVLENDLGDGLRLSSFPVMPSCGEILDWQEDGAIVYIADADTDCTVDVFEYEVEDNWGEKDTAIVTVFIEQFPLDLIVQVDRDCSNIFVEDTYVVDILFTGGTPPYKVNVNGEESIFEEPGFISHTICRYDGYEVTVTDSSGQDYYEISELPCFWWFSICGEKPDFDYEITCLGNGKVGIEMGSSFVSAHYTDNQGNEHELNPIDTIPNLSYLNIQVSDCASIDTLLNCLSANNDFIEVLEGDTISFNVLENDFGQEIKVSAILEMPQCAGIFEWDIDGSLVYKMMEGETCMEDEIVYELENSLGEKTTANVYLQKIEYQQMYLDWESICDDSDCDLLFTIVGGLSPYYIFAYYVSGTYNDIIEGDEFTIPTIGCAEKIELEIIDSGGEIFVFELNTYPLCYYEDCYEPGFVEDFVQLECLGELGTTMKFQNEMQLALLERSFWIDSNNQYHELKEFDTIPNNSYYYLEMQYYGHIDGYVNCLTTDIEGVEENIENIFLQLYPNPNSGQFSLQLNTPPTFSLQSFPIQIYDIAGRLIESHEIQGNSLETLDLENVQSGLYLLQVVLEDSVLTKRFLVE